jgi:hypothetical protein
MVRTCSRNRRYEVRSPSCSYHAVGPPVDQFRSLIQKYHQWSAQTASAFRCAVFIMLMMEVNWKK